MSLDTTSNYYNRDACSICLRPSNGFSVHGCMPWEKRLTPYVHVCLDCKDITPCGYVGSWWNGILTCPHGARYAHEAEWNPNIRGTAFLKYIPQKPTLLFRIKQLFGFKHILKIPDLILDYSRSYLLTNKF